ncbi:FAD-dependent monooxygenase [Amaricoccus tamworthensis]|uniref:FAD-dependent monooxygenase n=1 Tax=Amaricoccus tamworthensis TaxID=57002 RepID=UPI003C7AAB98
MTQPPECVEVLVAGGGVAGLAATALFASEGFTVACVDPAPVITSSTEAGSDLRSTAFLMPSVRLLQKSGLWDTLGKHATALATMRIADAGGEEPAIRDEVDFNATDVGEEVFGFNLPNWLLRHEMTENLSQRENVFLLNGMGVEHFTPRTSGNIHRLSDGSQITAQLTIGADGRNSRIREILDIDAKKWSYGQKALVFTVTHTAPHHNVSTEIHRTGGPFTLVPLPGMDGHHRSAIVWMDTGPRAMELAALDREAFEYDLNLRSCGVNGRLSLESERKVWPIISQVADRLNGPRTALVAEAAHVVPPIGAQGLNMSLADIATLGELCATARTKGKDIGAQDLLGKYNRQRHPDIVARVAGIDALNRAAMQENLVLRDYRRSALKLLHGLAPVRKSVMALGLGMGARQTDPVN